MLHNTTPWFMHEHILLLPLQTLFLLRVITPYKLIGEGVNDLEYKVVNA